jgi:ABC-type dipeptide/oligopeptide/nickel transport system permease component
LKDKKKDSNKNKLWWFIVYIICMKNISIPSFLICRIIIYSFQQQIIVFRSSSAQNPGSGFWLSHRVVRVIFFFFLKWRRFSKKNSTGCSRVFDRIARSVRFFLPLFFLQLGLVPAPNQPAGLGLKTRQQILI